MDRAAGALAPERPELLARAAQGPEAEADHPRPRLGRADPGAARVRGARRQADLRLVRRGHRLPVGGRRVGREPRDARRLARLVAGPRRAPPVLHGQGQHRLPHGDLAEHPARVRVGRRARRGQGAADAPVRRRRERVPDDGGQAVQRQPRRLDRRRRLPEPLRPRPASLLPDRGWAGDAGHRLHVVGVRAPEQRRARRELGQPRQPDAELGAQELRRGARAGRADGRGPRAPRCDRGRLRDRRRSDRVRALPGCAR